MLQLIAQIAFIVIMTGLPAFMAFSLRERD